MIMREEGLEQFIGKTVGEIITDDTKMLTDFMKGFDVKKQILKKDWLSLESYETLSVLTDLENGLVICFKKGIPVCLFNVYEISDVSLNGKRGVVNATGHETVHEYWLDNGEYNIRHIR